MTEITDWIQTYYQEVIAIYGLLVAVASIIVKLTPTLKDDGFLLKITKFVSTYIALNRGVKDSEIRKLAE